MLLDNALARRSNVIRKLTAYGLRVPRAARKTFSSKSDYQAAPPVIANSIPKSGTHLLVQLARALPGTAYYGSFVAQQPSLSLRLRQAPEVRSMVTRLAPGEVVGAHLHYDQSVSQTLADLNAVHLMIVRDPLDVVLSEAHYLANMNRFHRMAREFRGLDRASQIRVSLEGSSERPDLFGSLSHRISPYLGWLDQSRVCIVRYEEFSPPEERAGAIARIISAWRNQCIRSDLDDAALATSLDAAIAPEKSHTVSGRTEDQGVRQALAADPRVAAMRERLGYPTG